MRFPLHGLDRSRGFNFQQPLTTPIGKNVRAFEAATGRARGGVRPGLSRYINAIPGGSAATIQDLNIVVGCGYTDPGGSAQSNVSGRIVDVVAVVGGRVYVASAGGTSWVTSGGSGTLASSGQVRSTSLNQQLYFADGTNWTYYDPATNLQSTLVASAGSLPSDGANTPRLIENWGGRLMVAGISSDPKNWHGSAMGEPADWDTAPTTTLSTQAITGNNSTFGHIGSPITALIPWSDDVLIFGCDDSIWMMNGDPMFGGKITRVSDGIGMAFGKAWCKGPDGTIYFFSNRPAIYAMEPGGRPIRISQQISQLLEEVNSGTHLVRMLWDEVQGGFHVFITTRASATADTHYFWEQDAGAWWQDSYGNDSFNPLCCTVFDGNLPADRVGLIGSFDGYVRALSASATDDDGYDIESAVLLGPLLTNDLDALLSKDLQAVFSTGTGEVTYSVYVANTAEEAVAQVDADQAILDGTALGTLARVSTGTWGPGRSFNTPIRRKGYATYLKLESTDTWALEQIRDRVAGKGRIQRRGV